MSKVSPSDIEATRKSEIKDNTWHKPILSSKKRPWITSGWRAKQSKVIFSTSPIEPRLYKCRKCKWEGQITGNTFCRMCAQKKNDEKREKRHASNQKNIASSIAGDSERHVRVRGEIALYQVKGPWVEAGRSILGGVEYNKALDLVKCHECGEWMKSIGSHSWCKHGLRAQDYKRKYQLPGNASLVSEGLRKKFSESCVRRDTAANLIPTRMVAAANGAAAKMAPGFTPKTMEAFNARGMCPAQIIEKLQRLKQLFGRAPTRRELREHGVKLHSMEYIFGSVNEAMKIAGIPLNGRGNLGVLRKFSTEQLLEFLRMFYRLNGHPPRMSDFKRRFLPSYKMYHDRFGKLANAWKSAGLPAFNNGARGK